MAIQGEKRERQALPEFSKKVGLFEATVIAINPTVEEFKDVLGMELAEDSKAAEYLGTNAAGNTYLRVDFWLQEVKNKDKFKVTFFLEDKERENKDGTKKQYINNIGTTTWATDENNLPEWFTERDYRVANVGEEELYNFMRTWLELNYTEASADLSLDWRRLMKGNVKELKEQIGGAYAVNVTALATITVKQKDGENKEYQSIYNKAFLPAGYLKNFRLINYSDSNLQSTLRSKKLKDLKLVEKFVVNVTGEYGCKDYYILRDLQDYNPGDNLVASDAVLSDDGSDF